MTEQEKLKLKLKVKKEHSARLTKELTEYLYYEGPIETYEEAKAALDVRNELDGEISEIESQLKGIKQK